jgi:hypothetical protein
LLVGEQLVESCLDLRGAGEGEVQVVQTAVGCDASEVVGGVGPGWNVALKAADLMRLYGTEDTCGFAYRCG